MNIQKQLNKYSANLKGKTVAVTGATGGLGSCFCRCLAMLGADIVMLDRNMEKSLVLKSKIVTEFPEIKIDNVRLDLGNRASMDDACAQLVDRKIDFLVLNAGIYNVPITVGESGYNNVFKVNFVSPYSLVKSLLPNIKSANGKIIAVGSIAHKWAKLDETDVDHSRRKGASKIYGNSKRFLMFALSELLKDESGVRFTIVHPGITPTPMTTTHYRRATNGIVKAGMSVLFPSPEKAALNLVHALFTDCGYHEWIGPKRFDVWGKPAVKKLSTCKPPECKRLYEIAEEIYNQTINKD